ncbi:isocitrate lyase/phosphoenolpyruvate mutase family protein [Streptomyces sp. NPDC012769]|uniref:isocitrate lyase/phosphoenolpyruvate mutase family protein n=1 Tax=Streptomyces sp. NPDC012769 TaxID=3364848 RepID=UPI0036A004AA
MGVIEDTVEKFAEREFRNASATSPEFRNAERRSGPARLRELFGRPGALRIVGAHNPLGARLAERAGFDGVWSSGLEVSASQGLPDTDLLTMSELLAVAGSMAAAVDIPVVADCDAGYGNALNVMHMVRRYEAAGVAAVCVEDKRFPKVNSFVPGRQELEPVEVFAGKIAAAKAAQRDPDLMVIARTESLIAGWGMDEALLRADAYAAAGADAVLIHAKGASPEPVLEFLERWRGRLPVVVVPTTYHTVTFDELRAAGAKLVIYANHGLRAGISAVSEVFEAILSEGRTTGFEGRIAPLATVFDLQGMDRLKADEARFIPEPAGRHSAVVLPAEGSGPAPAAGADPRIRAVRAAGVGTVLLPSGEPGHDAQALLGADSGAARTAVLGGTTGPDDRCLRVALAGTDPIAVVHGHPAVHSPGLSAVSSAAHSPEPSAVFCAVFSAEAYAALREAAAKRIADGRPDTSLAVLVEDLRGLGWPVTGLSEEASATGVTATEAGATEASARNAGTTEAGATKSGATESAEAPTAGGETAAPGLDSPSSTPATARDVSGAKAPERAGADA